jgi:hypothetical protein
MIGSGTPAGAAAPSIRAFAAFGWAWLAYALLVVAFPGSPIAGSVGRAIAIDAAFVVCVMAAAGMTLRVVPKTARSPSLGSDPLGKVGAVAWVGLVLGALGFVCLLFDRTSVQGIDFSSGLAAARGDWQRAATYRTGASSVFSMLGYALVGCSMAGACAVLRRANEWLTAAQVAYLLVCVLVAFAFDAMNGGRTSLLLFPALCAASWVLNPRLSLRRVLRRPWVIALAVLAVVYCLLVFDSRIAVSDMDTLSYSLTLLEHLRIEPSPWLQSMSVPNACWLVMLAWAYLVHSFSITCEVAVLPVSDHLVLGSHVLSLLQKLGLDSHADADWILSGRFPGLPASLYHMMGIPGLTIGASILGSTTALTVRAASRWPGSIAALGGVAGCVAVLLLSPLLAAFDLLAFPSAMLGFVVLAIVERCLRAPNR